MSELGDKNPQGQGGEPKSPTGFDSNTKILNSADYRERQQFGGMEKSAVQPVMSAAELQEIETTGDVPGEVISRMLKEAEAAGNRGYNSVIKQYGTEIDFRINKALVAKYRESIGEQGPIEDALRDTHDRNEMGRNNGLGNSFMTETKLSNAGDYRSQQDNQGSSGNTNPSNT